MRFGSLGRILTRLWIGQETIFALEIKMEIGPLYGLFHVPSLSVDGDWQHNLDSSYPIAQNMHSSLVEGVGSLILGLSTLEVCS